MSDDQQLQKLWTQVGDLSRETTVLSLLLTSLIASDAKASPDAQAWVAKFADDVQSSIKEAPDAPDDVKAHIKQFRDRLDFLINAVRLRLGK